MTEEHLNKELERIMRQIKRRAIGLVCFLAAIVIWGAAYADQRDIYRPVTEFNFGYTTSGATPASTMGAQTRVARVLCTTACEVAFSASAVVTSSTTSVYLPAATAEYFRVTPGHTIYVQAVSTAGIVYVTEME